jgi:hypothetical protein
MSYIVVTTWYPSHIALEVAQKYLEAMQAIPEDENLASTVVPIAASPTKDGIKAMNIAEAKPGKLEEALQISRQRLAFFREIVGFEYAIEVQFTAAEALAGVGISAP